MKSYKVEIPENYDAIRALGEEVSETITNRMVPKPSDIALVLGKDAVKPYYFMHALFHDLEYGRNRSIFDYKRRDRIAIQRHSFDGAFKPYYRLTDKDLPSNYFLNPREITGVLVHDLGEEFGQSLLGAIVINDAIKHVLGEKAGKDADVLTNKSALLLDSLEGRIEKVPVTAESIYNIVKEAKSEVIVRPGTVIYQYQRALNALKQFQDYVKNQVDYIDNDEKKVIIGIIDEIKEGIVASRPKALKADDIAGLVLQQHDGILRLIKEKEYTPVDKHLLLPGDPEFLLTLKKTLYNRFVDNIAERVREEAKLASRNGNTQDDDYLAAYTEKVAESTDTVANMSPEPLHHPMSIFRKARITIRNGIGLVNYLRQEQMHSERLQMAVDYLYRNLDDVVNQYLNHFKSSKRRDTNWKLYVNKFGTMRSKTAELGKMVTEMNGPSWLRKKSRNLARRLVALRLLF